MDSHFLDDCGLEGHDHLYNELEIRWTLATVVVRKLTSLLMRLHPLALNQTMKVPLLTRVPWIAMILSRR